jgi:SAM-dependent methyltransferase
MSFWTKSEAAKEFHVSPTTINNWIIATEKNKVNLDIATVGTKTVLVESEHNRKIIKQLIEKGKKHIGRGGRVEVEVSDRFYKIFSQSQAIEIITNLENDKLIPLKYTYFDKGASMWDDYIIADLNNPDYSYNKKEEILINSTLSYLDLKIQKYDKVNIIDIGPGNGYIAKPIINKLIDLKKDIKYTGMDISSSMLDILKKNLGQWYPNLNTEYVLTDIDYDIIRDHLFFNKHNEEKSSCNIILFLGSTIGNFYDRHRVYKNFYDSMSQDDFLWINSGIETPGEVSAIKKHAKKDAIVEESSWIPELLGIEEDLYALEVNYNEKIESYVLCLRLNVDLDIVFTLQTKEKRISLNKGDDIIVWNYHSYKLEQFVDELNNVGFRIINQASYPDNSEAIIMSEKGNN